MSERYFVERPIDGDYSLLAGSEAHHLIHVMRAKPGQGVTLFDGSGREFAARVVRIGRAEVELAVVSHADVDRELPRPLVLGAALPKGERQKWLVEKAVELGVGRLVPLETARGVAQPVEQALVRLRRTVVEASKQCGRNRLMEIASPQGLAEFVAQADPAALRLLAHPASFAAAGGMGRVGWAERSEPHHELSGSYWWDSLCSAHPTPSFPPAGVVFAVGPEGGFTDEEVALATAGGWKLIDLGPRILRVETAALALAAMANGWR